MDTLRLAAFCAYLAAWLVLAVAAALSAIPRARKAGAPAIINLSASSIAGTLLQVTSALPITLSLPPGPLRPNRPELAAALILSPFAAGLFVWALRSAPTMAGVAGALVTRGAYRWLRHPIYLAFFAMLLATGLLASAGPKLLIAAAMFLLGSELRSAAEEADLARRFPAEYPAYRRRTRWRYLPGLR